MNEQDRLKELDDYQVLDTDPEMALDEFVEIASAVCDTPISLITLLDHDRQWFKANKGLKAKQTPKSDSFCQYALNKPNEVLVINDAWKDQRFVDNPLVIGYPGMRFYAGAPLTTPNGNVLGTLCVIDSKPKKISDNQKKALLLLAKKVMDYLEGRKAALVQRKNFEKLELKLKSLTDQAPGVIYQFRMTTEGKMSFDFISNGVTALHSELHPELIIASPELAFSFIHPEDLPKVMNSIQESFINLTEWNMEFRSLSKNNEVKWQMGKSNPVKQANGDVIWYGTYQDITERVEYRKILEEIAFDISHILRRPVTTLLGLMNIISEENQLTTKKIKTFLPYIKSVSQELDDYTRKLNEVYQAKKKSMS